MFTRVAAFIQDLVNLLTPSLNPLHGPSQLPRDRSPRVNFCDLVVPTVVLLSLAAIGRMALLLAQYRHRKLFLQRRPSQLQPSVLYLNRLQLSRLRITGHHPRRLSVLLHHHPRLLPQRLRQPPRNLPPRCCTISLVTDLTSLPFMREKSSRLSPRKEMVCRNLFFSDISGQ
jgi:hypothetical protein